MCHKVTCGPQHLRPPDKVFGLEDYADGWRLFPKDFEEFAVERPNTAPILPGQAEAKDAVYDPTDLVEASP